MKKWYSLAISSLLVSTFFGQGVASANEDITRYLPLSKELQEIDTCRDDFGDPESDGFFEYLTYVDSRQRIQTPEIVTIKTYFSQDCSGIKTKYQQTLELVMDDGSTQALRPTMERSLERDDYRYYDDPTECGRYVFSCWSHSKEYGIQFLSREGTEIATTDSVGLRITVSYSDRECSFEDSGAGRVSICSDVPKVVSQTIPDFFIVTRTPNPSPVDKNQESLIEDPGSSGEKEADSQETKLNAGSFKGYVALYAKGYKGHKLSAKVGRDWVVIPSLDSDFERIVEYTGAGYEINVRIYIDGILETEIPVLTR